MSVTTQNASSPSGALSEAANPSGSAGGLQSVEQMLSTQQREELRVDLAEIARRRRMAEETSSSLRLG